MSKKQEKLYIYISTDSRNGGLHQNEVWEASEQPSTDDSDEEDKTTNDYYKAIGVDDISLDEEVITKFKNECVQFDIKPSNQLETQPWANGSAQVNQVLSQSGDGESWLKEEFIEDELSDPSPTPTQALQQLDRGSHIEDHIYHSCVLCNAQLGDPKRLSKHLLSHIHASSPDDPFSSQWGSLLFTCDICGSVHDTRNSLFTHRMTHHPKAKPYVCDICKEQFNLEASYRDHRKIHTLKHHSPWKYVCDVCGKTVTRLDTLFKHKQIHTGKTPYKCGVCGVGYRSGHGLGFHQRSTGHSNALSEKSKHRAGKFPKENQKVYHSCVLCNTKLDDPKRLSKHMISHIHSSSPDDPFRPFVHSSRLGSLLFTCDICGSVHDTRNSLFTHRITLHPKAKPYVCDICKEQFNLKASYREHRKAHKRKHHSPWKYVCDVCGMTVTRLDALYRHKKIHTGNTQFKCSVCGVRYRSGHGLVHHQRLTGHLNELKDHLKELKEISKRKAVKLPKKKKKVYHSCVMCNAQLGDPKKLSIHLISHIHASSPGDPFEYSSQLGYLLFTCDICGSVHYSRHSFFTHRLEFHPKAKPYVCDICNEQFNCEDSYKEHRRAHRRKRQRSFKYACDVCGKQVTKLEALFKHKQIHTGKTPFKCGVCGVGYRSGHGLGHHQRLTGHTKAPPDPNLGRRRSRGRAANLATSIATVSGNLRCNMCNAGLKDVLSIQRHMVGHLRNPLSQREGIKFKIDQCQECGKWFKNLSDLTNHWRVHTGEKPFTCEICGKQLRYRYSYNDHMRIHTGEKPYLCTVCGKQWVSSVALYIHKKSHLEKPQHRCDLCGAAFNWKWKLANHKRDRCKMKRKKKKKKPSGLSEGGLEATSAAGSEVQLANHREIFPEVGWTNPQCSATTSQDKGSKQTVIQMVSSKDGEAGCHGEMAESTNKTDDVSSGQVCEGTLPQQVKNSHKQTSNSKIENKVTEPEAEKPREKYKASKPQAEKPSNKKKAPGRPSKTSKGGGGLYECEVCGKVLKYRYSYLDHQRIHTGEKPYSCDVCGKRWGSSAALYIHKKSHMDLKPFPCDVCGKAFAWNWKLVKHMKCHSKTK